VEIELQQKHMTIQLTEIHIPCPYDFLFFFFSCDIQSCFLFFRAPPTVENAEGNFRFDGSSSVLMWRVASLSVDNPTSSLEFRVPFEGDSSSFFPIRVHFATSSSVSNLTVGKVCLIDEGTEVPFSVEPKVEVESYEVVFPQN
jgi:hypothetical protein